MWLVVSESVIWPFALCLRRSFPNVASNSLYCELWLVLSEVSALCAMYSDKLLQECLVWYPEQILIVDKTEVSVKVWHMFNMFQWFLVITCSSNWLSTALHQFLPSSFYKPDSSYQIIYLSFIPSSWHWPFHIRRHVVSWGYKQLSRNFIVN